MNILAKISREWWLLFLAMLLYLACFIYFYPPLSAIEDEVGFINQAWLMKDGKISHTSNTYNGYHLGDLVEINDQYISTRNPGRSLTLLPFITLFGMKSIYLSGAAIHLLVALAMALLCRGVGLSPLGGLLILLHPTFQIYSRTIMADAQGALFLILATHFFLKDKVKETIIASLFIFLAMITRYQIILFLPVFCLFAWRKHESKNFWLFSGLSAFFVICLALYNQGTHGAFLGVAKGRQSFGFEYFIPHFFFYMLATLIIYPLMFFAPIINIVKNWDQKITFISLLAVTQLFIFSFYYYYDQTSSEVETLVIGQRLFQLAIPFFVLSWLFIQEKLEFLKKNTFAVMILVLVLGVYPGLKLHQKHALHLQKKLMITKVIEQYVPEGHAVLGNTELSKLFSVPRPDMKRYTWGDINFMDFYLNKWNDAPVYAGFLKRDHSRQLNDPWEEKLLAKGFVRIFAEDPLYLFRKSDKDIQNTESPAHNPEQSQPQ